MKLFFLISLLYTFILADNSLIIIGTYTNEESSYKVLNNLDNIIEKNKKIKNIFNNNSLVIKSKKDGKYYIVTIGLFKNLNTLSLVLQDIKKMGFKDAFVIKSTSTRYKKNKQNENLNNNVSNTQILAIEPIKIETITKNKIVKPIKIKAVAKNKVVKTAKKELIYDNSLKVTQKKDTRILYTYFKIIESNLTEIIIFFILLISIILYFIFRGVQKNNSKTLQSIEIDDQDIEEKINPLNNTTKKPAIAVKKIIKDKKNNLKVANKIIPRKKSKVQPHGKIVKNDFKKFTNMRILLAEDNTINQKVITGLLADSGIEVIVANNGQEVLDILQKDKNFTLILMDAHMPILNGFEVTRIIKKNPDYNDIIIVALSGDVATDDIKKMKNAGMEEFLEKPLKMDALYDIFITYAANNKEKEIILENKKETQSLKELNTNIGISICANDEMFYYEILKEFVIDYSNTAKKLKLHLNKQNIIEADKLLLDIIGVTANIGAINLHKISQKLKKSIHNFKEENSLKILKEYEKHLNNLLKEIKIKIQK